MKEKIKIIEIIDVEELKNDNENLYLLLKEEGYVKTIAQKIKEEEE